MPNRRRAAGSPAAPRRRRTRKPPRYAVISVRFTTDRLATLKRFQGMLENLLHRRVSLAEAMFVVLGDHPPDLVRLAPDIVVAFPGPRRRPRFQTLQTRGPAMPPATIELQPLKSTSAQPTVQAPLHHDAEDGWVVVVDDTRLWSQHWDALVDALRREGYVVRSRKPPLADAD